MLLGAVLLGLAVGLYLFILSGRMPVAARTVPSRMIKEVCGAMPPMSRPDDRGFVHRYGQQRGPTVVTSVALCELR
ncbi:MAG TPA: hypothetical protein VLA67_10590 [Nitrospiraceae bacterium]|nr:hypothetical protein [Nitrospiraceae bacterium]